ncbi:acVLRF1 family peptidyl-tRNA hydrolase [Rhodococcus aerolatus]
MAARVHALPGGGRRVEVDRDRLGRFLDGVAARHGGVLSTEGTADGVVLRTGDATTVTVRATTGGLAPHPPVPGPAVADLLAHVALPRRTGLLLVRAGGHTAGVAVAGRVVVSSTDHRLVQGRSAAGGWSQQRFARRRAGQLRDALAQAADTAARVLLDADLAVLVTGGDRGHLDAVLADRRLAPLRALRAERNLEVGEPRRVTLDEAARRADGVVVDLVPG